MPSKKINVINLNMFNIGLFIFLRLTIPSQKNSQLICSSNQSNGTYLMKSWSLNESCISHFS